MDGFPNGRRLEDDVTTIELQAVSGVALAAIGLWYDDYMPGTSPSPVTTELINVITFDAGVTHNDTTFKTEFPFLQDPWRGFNGSSYVGPTSVPNLGLSTPLAIMSAYPNPFKSQVTFRYRLDVQGSVTIAIMDISGRLVKVLSEGNKAAGEYTTQWNSNDLAAGNYIAKLSVNNTDINTAKLVKTN